MIYSISLTFLFFLLVYSNFLSLKFKIKLNETFLVSICLILLFGYFSYKLQLWYPKFFLKYIFFVILGISFLVLPYLIKNNSRINTSLNLEFILIFIFIFALSKDRYYLDQDEITYWGRAIKTLFFNFDETIFNHHPQGLNVFRYLFVFPNFNEGMTIFSNNIILISGFYYLFYERKLILYEKFFLYLIYYLLLNNLSFGFLSIYSDPILALFYSCLLKKIFFILNERNFIKVLHHIFGFLIVGVTILIINRSALIYFIFALCTLTYLSITYLIYKYRSDYEYSLKKYNYFYICTIFIIIFLLFIYYIIPKAINGNYALEEILINLDILFKSNFFTTFYNLLFAPIYFSHFGVTLNGIFELLLGINFRIPEFQIPLLIYIIFLFPFLFFKFKYKFSLFVCTIGSLITYMIIILVLKQNMENLSLSALPRYLGIFILANYLFIISVVTFNNKLINKSFIFISMLIFLALVTPKKTLGFFVTDKFYHKNLSNKIFKENRNSISKLKEIKHQYDHILVLHQQGFSDYSDDLISGKHSFYHDIIMYELFPKQAKFLKINDYLKYEKNIISILKNNDSINLLVVLYDLPQNQIQKINFSGIIYKIETYEKNKF